MLLVYAILFLLHIILTVWFYLSGTNTEFVNYFYNILITLFVIIPFVQGIFYNKKHPELKPIIVPLQISNLLFAAALYIWFYYNITGNEIPYPSIADLFFIMYYPINLISLFYLTRQTGVKWTSGSIINTFLIFIFLSAISTIFLSNQSIDFSAPVLVIILNLIYPVLDSLLTAFGVTIMRSQKNFGYRYLFFYVFGYAFLGFADVIFAYQTNAGIYWNGNIVDLLYALGHMSIALGTNFLPTIFNSQKV
ncbi:hypothetical protein A2572_03435 [Candidatus Collierbacteria bacterium RIFOXYD1_FULL_40_9]|uniref:Uncharacterized protein n=1 Tax=Candidatus Collierbacteria bacterium RIFOXYD1_FULL_40_9 TaxID=1817731 RepID=A0A1F5FX40_9BACT|nr:MAG: hypothetical protein A2572_03435 [Candidatus Collierbacteria bacterium RIFOXYD1_FULL_40_9]